MRTIQRALAATMLFITCYAQDISNTPSTSFSIMDSRQSAGDHRVSVIHQVFVPQTGDLFGYVIERDKPTRVMKWSADSGKAGLIISLGDSEYVSTLAVDYSGSKIVLVLERPEGISLSCRNIQTNKELWRIPVSQGCYEFAWFIPSRDFIGLAGPRQIRLYGARTGLMVTENDSLLNEYHTNSVRWFRIAASRSGQLCVVWNVQGGRGDNPFGWLSAKPNKWVTVWDVVSGMTIARIPSPDVGVRGIAFTPDETKLMISSTRNVLQLIPIIGSDSVRTIDCPFGWSIHTSDSTCVLADRQNLIVLNYPELATIQRLHYAGSYFIVPPTPQMALSYRGDRMSVQIGSKLVLYSTNPWREIRVIDPCAQD